MVASIFFEITHLSIFIIFNSDGQHKANIPFPVSLSLHKQVNFYIQLALA